MALVLRKGKEEIERANLFSMSSSNSLPTMTTTHVDLHRSNTIHVDDRVLLNVETNKSENEVVNDSTQTKKKLRKQDENLVKLIESPDCLDEASLTLNFLLRRMFCDVFEDPTFQNLLKEKLELKLKEIAVRFSFSSNSLDVLLV